MNNLKIDVILKNNAKIPKKGSMNSAGFDISSNEDKLLNKWSRSLISTGVFLKNLDPQYYIRIAPRSGLALKNIDVGAGVVDSDYRGEMKVVLINSSDNSFEVKKGDRIAQLIITKHENNAIMNGYTDNGEIVHDTKNMNLRGENGFGSTGI